jgi:hypothetical protein
MPSDQRPQSLDNLEKLLRGLPAPSVPSGLEAKLLSQVPSAGQVHPVLRVRRSLWRRPAAKIGFAVAGIAAVLCLGMALGWFAHRSSENGTDAPRVPGIANMPIESEHGPEARTVCNVLRVDPVARTVTIVVYRLPNGHEASTEARTFALAPDCRIVMDGKAFDLRAMTPGQPVTDYVVTDGMRSERLAFLNVNR